MSQATDFMLGEVIIYVFSILFILFDAYIITKIVLLCKKKAKVNIDWKFAVINIFLFVLTYAILIITYLMLFIPHIFNIALLTTRQRDAFKAITIVLFVTYFFRYFIFILTARYSLFTSDKNKITFLTHDLLFNQIKKIDDKKGFIVLKCTKEAKDKKKKQELETKIFLKKTKLSKVLLQQK